MLSSMQNKHFLSSNNLQLAMYFKVLTSECNMSQMQASTFSLSTVQSSYWKCNQINWVWNFYMTSKVQEKRKTFLSFCN